jgi:outer membrane cobalamin receptor
MVDGKPQLLDSLKTIPFSKIRSIEFSDGEASRALYGSPAKVGVIFIEIKKETKK